MKHLKTICNDLLRSLQIDDKRKWQNKALEKHPSIIALYALIASFWTTLRKKQLKPTLWACSRCKFLKNSLTVKGSEKRFNATQNLLEVLSSYEKSRCTFQNTNQNNLYFYKVWWWSLLNIYVLMLFWRHYIFFKFFVTDQKLLFYPTKLWTKNKL